MNSPPTPENEALRLAALRQTGKLDTVPEPAFDRITALAARLFGVPIALVSLIDAQRQWFKSRIGLDATETPRDVAFCGHAILGDEILEIADPLADERFCTNPLVLDGPRIRYYAGAPLTVGPGLRLGTLCIIDTKPRAPLTAGERQTLQDLAAIVSAELKRSGQFATAIERRQEIEHALADHLEAVAAAAPLAIVTLDRAGAVAGWNPAATQLFGWRAADVEGRSAPFAEGPDRESWLSLLGLVNAGHSARDVELKLSRKDGGLVEVAVSAEPLREAGGAITGCLATIADVGGRKRVERERAAAEGALADTQSRLGALLTMTSDAVVAADDGGKIVAWSRGAETMFGIAAGDMLLRSLTAIIPERHRAAHSAGMQRVAEAGHSRLAGRVVELEALRGDGSEFPVELSITSWRQEGRLMFAAIIRDITARKRADADRAALLSRLERQSASLNEIARNRAIADGCIEDAFRLIARAASEALRVARTGIWMLDHAQGVLRPMTIWSDGGGWIENVPPVEMSACPRYIAALNDARGLAVRDARADPRTSELLAYLEANGIAAMLDAPVRVHGEVVGVVCNEHVGAEREWTPDERQFAASLGDLAALALQTRERNDVIRTLEKARNAAETASRAKSNFLANMSHELRTPLNAIIGFSEMMDAQMLGPLGNAQYKSYAKDILGSGRHLLSIITTILDMAKAEAGQVGFTEEPVELGSLLDETRRMVALQAEAKSIAIEIARGAKPRVKADRQLLRQAVLNVLANAVKFTPQGGRVDLHVGQEADSSVAVIVRDTGIGMRAEDIPRAFEPFAQVDADLDRRFEGTGLGLPLAKRYVEKHGGLIRVDSRPGHGTEMRIILPPERVLPAES